MRIALAGKGGVGKTTISATLARLAARQGRTVVAIDADSNPNLALALGASGAPDGMPRRVVSRRFDGAALTTSVDDVVDTYGIPGPDGLRVVAMGSPAHADEGCMCSAHATVSALLADAGPVDVDVIVDMEASPEHLSRGTARHVDVLLLVTEPYYRSLEAVRRLADLAAELPIPRVGVVISKVRSPEDAEAVRAFCDRHDLSVIGEIPWSEAAVTSDVAARPLLDAHPDDPAVAAIGDVLRAVLTVPALERS